VTRVICDEHDREAWLAHRRKFITSSDLMVFMGKQPSFWSFTSRESIIEDKMGAGIYEPNHNTEHGIANEETNRVKAERLLGMSLPRCQKLCTNSKWPALAATPDCYALPGPLAAPYKLLTSHPDLVDRVRDRVAGMHSVGGCQLKSTDAARAVNYGKRGYGQLGTPQDWITHPPEYHLIQVRAEMAIMGWEWGLLVGQLGAHNMVAWFIEQEPAFLAWLDEANEDAATTLGAL
jgi:hypothetical protein